MLSKKQKKFRRLGIGGSDVAAILGISSFENMTPMKIWMQKTGRDESDLSEFEPAIWGNLLEDDVAKRYEMVKKCKLEKIKNTLIHPEHDWLRANIDRKIVGNDKILECKVASPTRKNYEKWGESGTDLVPIEYFMQVQHYLSVTGYFEADLAVFFTIFDFRIYTIKRDDEIINKMNEKLYDFWHRHVLTDIPPQPISKDEVQIIYPSSNDDFIELTPEIEKEIEIYKITRNQLEALEKQKKKLETTLTSIIGNTSGIKQDKKSLITWKKTKRGYRTLRLYGD